MTAKKYLCNIMDKKLKKLLSKESIDANEFQEIIKLDYIMTDENMCGVKSKKKDSDLVAIKKMKKRLFG